MSSFDEKIIKIVSNMSGDNPFKDKWISIIGSRYSATIGRNLPFNEHDPEMALEPLNSVLFNREQLWWNQLIRKLEGKLCANLTGDQMKLYDMFNSAFYKQTAEVKRKAGVEYTDIDGNIEVFDHDINPDIIIIETSSIMEMPLSESLTYYEDYESPSTSDQGLLRLGKLLMAEYPKAVIYIMNVGWDYMTDYGLNFNITSGPTMRDYNKRIEEIALYFRTPLIRIDQLGKAFWTVGEDAILDGQLSPNAQTLLARKCYNDMMAYGVV